MRITRFTAENFKRIKAIDITPDEHTVVIAGRNAQGKSSVLDGIMAALAGRNGAKELVRPVRDGETKARVAVELDDLIVERKWTPSGSTVTVTPKGGTAKLNAPQKVLDSLIGSLSFDPLEFAEAEPRAQVETLIDLVGREQFDLIAESRKAAYENRTSTNREVKSIKARLDALGHQPVEVEPVDVGELLGLFAKLQQRAALRAEWERLQKQIEQLIEKQTAIALEASQLPDGDAEEVLARLRDAEKINKAAAAWQQQETLSEEYGEAQGLAANFTEQIEAMDAMRADLIAKAELPVDGLGFDDDGVTLNGVPFVQSSAAERLKVSVAMAMALNPELRVICIRDASLLDNDSKQVLVELAEANDFQIFYEVVGDGGPVGIIIEDGMVAE
jgi:DNA repair ATPase RecN